MSGSENTRKRIDALDRSREASSDATRASCVKNEVCSGSNATSLDYVAADLDALASRLAKIEERLTPNPGGPASGGRAWPVPEEAPPAPDEDAEAYVVKERDGIGAAAPWNVMGPGYWRGCRDSDEAEDACDLLNTGWREAVRTIKMKDALADKPPSDEEIVSILATRDGPIDEATTLKLGLTDRREVARAVLAALRARGSIVK